MKILVDENIPFLADALIPCGDVINFSGRELTNNNLKETKCEALFVRSTTKVDEKLIKGTDIKFVGSATSGIDHIDKNYLDNQGIYFADAAGSNSNSVAELVIFSMLLWARYNNHSLTGKAIGIVGFGNIGKIAGRYASLLKMNVIINDPPLKQNGYKFPDYAEYAELNDLCKLSDVITNHVPLTYETDYPTYKLFNLDNINLIKDGSLFIHASRGKVVDENALLNKSLTTKLFTVIDVWENEPLINKALAKQSLLSTAHIAGYSRDGKLKGALLMASAFKEFSGLKPDLTSINNELSSYSPLSADKFTDIDYIYKILKSNRKFEFDHAKLIETLSLPDQERAEQFDKLRKEYPIRRESL